MSPPVEITVGDIRDGTLESLRAAIAERLGPGFEGPRHVRVTAEQGGYVAAFVVDEHICRRLRLPVPATGDLLRPWPGEDLRPQVGWWHSWNLYERGANPRIRYPGTAPVLGGLPVRSVGRGWA